MMARFPNGRQPSISNAWSERAVAGQSVHHGEWRACLDILAARLRGDNEPGEFAVTDFAFDGGLAWRVEFEPDIPVLRPGGEQEDFPVVRALHEHSEPRTVCTIQSQPAGSSALRRRRTCTSTVRSSM